MYRVMNVDLEQSPFSAYSETLPRTYNYGYMYEPVNTDHDPLASDILSLDRVTNNNNLVPGCGISSVNSALFLPNNLDTTTSF